MKQTAVDYLIQELFTVHDENFDFNPVFEKAKEIEKKQIFKALNQSAKEAYIAGQQTMSCGCYEIRDALT